MTKKGKTLKLEVHPLTKKRWSDFERLFGERGACGGCWCMYWRLKRQDFEKKKGEGNKRAMKAVVGSGEIPGLLAYAHGQAVGWCSVAPRQAFPVLQGSRILKEVDDTPVWSIVCFFIDKDFRNTGMSAQLLKAAIEHVKKQGGNVLEGYPVEPKKDKYPAVFAFTGFSSAFKEAGFAEVTRRSETRPIMRFFIKKKRSG
jgi:GNAT superfamily N-acetyltransferase